MPPNLTYPSHLDGTKGIQQARLVLDPEQGTWGYPVTQLLPPSKIRPVFLYSGVGPYVAFRRSVRCDAGGGQNSTWPFWWTLVHPSAIRQKEEASLIPVRFHESLISEILEWLPPLTEVNYEEIYRTP